MTQLCRHKHEFDLLRRSWMKRWASAHVRKETSAVRPATCRLPADKVGSITLKAFSLLHASAPAVALIFHQIKTSSGRPDTVIACTTPVGDSSVRGQPR
jgi:hypothetical protein